MRLTLEPPPGNQPGTTVLVDNGARHSLAAELAQTFGNSRHVVIGDERVLELWLQEISLPDCQGVLRIPAGERAKTATVLVDVCRELCAIELPRDSFVVAVGGGAAGDLVGLAASLHLRGVPVVQVPTTLLSMVDAGLGGKCAINLPEGKNLFGSFHAPHMMLVDPEFLTTLPEVEFRSGIGEIAKYALGFSAELATDLETNGLGAANLTATIRTCIRTKAEIVERDMFESRDGRRILLNLGHTAAHALEAWAQDRQLTVPHGLAVGWGLRIASDLAIEHGSLAEHDRNRAMGLLDRLALPKKATDLVPDAPERDALLHYVRRDKKIASGTLRVILPRRVGACAVAEVTFDQFAAALDLSIS